jgi:hypothetical protein
MGTSDSSKSRLGKQGMSMKMYALIVLSLTFGLAEAAPQPARAKANQISACPSNDFEEFVRIATARGESASKYAAGKIARYRLLTLAPSAGDSEQGSIRFFDFVTARSVDSKFYDHELVNEDSKKRGFPDAFEKPLLTQLKPNLFAINYVYEGTENAWQQLFETHKNCFRYIGYKSFDFTKFRENLNNAPTYADSGLSLFTSLESTFVSGGLDPGSFGTSYLRYSTLSEKNINGKKKLEQLNLPRKELLALAKFPFRKKPLQPMDQELWELNVVWDSANEVVVKVQEKNDGVARSDWRSIEYYFSPIKGVMHLVQIVDRHGILRKN